MYLEGSALGENPEPQPMTLDVISSQLELAHEHINLNFDQIKNLPDDEFKERSLEFLIKAREAINELIMLAIGLRTNQIKKEEMLQTVAHITRNSVLFASDGIDPQYEKYVSEQVVKLLMAIKDNLILFARQSVG